MIGTFSLITISVKAKSGWPLLLAAIIQARTAERVRQFELSRQLGTLASHIENCKLLGQDCSALQRKYDELTRLRK